MEEQKIHWGGGRVAAEVIYYDVKQVIHQHEVWVISINSKHVILGLLNPEINIKQEIYIVLFPLKKENITHLDPGCWDQFGGRRVKVDSTPLLHQFISFIYTFYTQLKAQDSS